MSTCSSVIGISQISALVNRKYVFYEKRSGLLRSFGCNDIVITIPSDTQWCNDVRPAVHALAARPAGHALAARPVGHALAGGTAALFQFERAGIQPVVGSLLGQQLLVAAPLDDAPVIQHHDAVGIADGA